MWKIGSVTLANNLILGPMADEQIFQGMYFEYYE